MQNSPSPLAIVHAEDGYDDPADTANDGLAQNGAPHQLATRVVTQVETIKPPYIKEEGQLVIDHKIEGIVNAIRDMSIPKEAPTLFFNGGLHLSGEFTAGSIEVDGTLIIGEGSVVNVQKLKAKRLYINQGALHCVSIKTGSLIAWDGEINASHEIEYGALEESRFCAINGTMRWVRGS
ncbi:MAG: polymer-forming cytoskeletal protein [Nevskiaceae bacterium]|nr:MAG: polymer-forming cytoskeletal protein [Nevskiaceae bacterium]